MSVTLKPLSEQVVVITGASSGIGLATAEMAARRGARVVLSSRDESDLRTATERIRTEGGRATWFAAVTMPLTYSIATGIGLGFITYALAKLIAGRMAQAKPAVLILAAIFALKFALTG